METIFKIFITFNLLGVFGSLTGWLLSGHIGWLVAAFLCAGAIIMMTKNLIVYHDLLDDATKRIKQ